MNKKQDLNQPATKKDIYDLKKDVNKQMYVLKKDVTGLKKDVTGLKKDVTGLKKDVTGLGWTLEKKFIEHEEKYEKMLYNFRNDIMNHVDKVMGELKTTREEQTLSSHIISRHSGQIKNHEKRITLLEQKPFPPQPSFA